jgi:hypothetical protein
VCPTVVIPSCGTGKVVGDDIVVPPGTSCGCRIKKCVDKPKPGPTEKPTIPPDFKGCTKDGKAIEKGATFQDDDCTLCTCLGDEKKECKKYCESDADPTCKAGQKKVETEYTVSGTKCKCMKKTCKDEVCFYNGITHKKGAKFEVNACTTCECQGADLLQCTPLCTPSTEKCNADSQRKLVFTKVVQGTSCVCTNHKCQDIECPISLGRTIKKGESFVQSPCVRCACGGDGRLTCKNLCPTGFLNNAVCAANQNTMITPHTITETTCSCPIKKCVTKMVQKTCTCPAIDCRDGYRAVTTAGTRMINGCRCPKQTCVLIAGHAGTAGCKCGPLKCFWPYKAVRTGTIYTDEKGCTCPGERCVHANMLK